MPLISPWTWSTSDYAGKVLSVTITFDNITFSILTVTAHKDPGCQYNNFYSGLGADGTPNTAPAQFVCADGDSIIGVAVLNGFGYFTINDLLAHQVTAGP